MTKHERKLKLFNGRIMLKSGKQGHGYVAAYSAADAVRVLNETIGGRGNVTEIQKYWNHNCWGNSMDGIKPERGLWVSEDRFGASPKRIKPKYSTP